MIAIVDRLVVRGRDAAEIHERYLTAYAPRARDRGMTMREAMTAPPVILPEGENVLTFIWSVADLPAWWRMRLAAARDAETAAFWQVIDAIVISRERTHNDLKTPGSAMHG